MIDAETYVRLQNAIRRESRTLLQYAVEAFPWTNVADRPALFALQTLAKEEADEALHLARFLRKHHLTPPTLGSYPTLFTHYNFLGLARLLPLLVKHQRDDIAAAEQDVAATRETPVRLQLEGLLALKQKHLLALEALQVPA